MLPVVRGGRAGDVRDALWARLLRGMYGGYHALHRRVPDVRRGAVPGYVEEDLSCLTVLASYPYPTNQTVLSTVTSALDITLILLPIPTMDTYVLTIMRMYPLILVK